MKVRVMNGWNRDLMHCWWRYVLLPFGWDNNRLWFSVSFFGFVFFFLKRV